MRVEELKATQTKIGLIMQVVVDMPLQEMAEQIERVDVLGPILDPTAWLDSAPSIQEWRQVLKPMLEFQKVARDLVARCGRREEEAEG